jgi:hypothetical protein
MLAKCANPECSAVFRSASEGKIYRMPSASAGHKQACVLEHFWLCQECVSTMTVAVERSGRVVVMRRSLLRPYRETVGEIHKLPVVSALMPRTQMQQAL